VYGYPASEATAGPFCNIRFNWIGPTVSNMRVLITGAYGLIGAACLAKLHAEGHVVVGAGRSITSARRRFPYAEWVQADFRELTDPESWRELLSGVDAVVNCVGALQDGARDDVTCVHVTAPAALFAACEQARVRVVHVSAVGASPTASTAFARTKGEAERELSERHLDWLILRPGLVIARGVYGGTALLRAAAGFPLVTPVLAAKPIHIVAIEDLAETVAWALRPGAPSRLTLDLVHPKPLTLGGIVSSYQSWLGFAPKPVVTLPRRVSAAIARAADALSWLGWRSPLRTTAITQLAEGIAGDPGTWIAAAGIVPKRLDEWMALHPATVQDRWFARLYVMKPIAITVLAAFWIATGIIALGPGWSGALQVTRLAGFGPADANIAVAVGAALDIALGIAVLIHRFSRAALIGMLAVSFAYLAAAAIAVPQLYADPLGSMLKVFPITLTIAFVLAILDER
jgi:uncharacterized protein YbjT (DUF2867 family)